MLKTIAKLDGLRRAPGPQGEIKKVHVEGGCTVYLTEDGGLPGRRDPRYQSVHPGRHGHAARGTHSQR